MKLILASTSRYRQELLDRLGLSYEAVDHGCDEDAFKGTGLSPQALSERLALEKAASLRESHPGAWILGSDQVLDLAGEILGKPGTVERAETQLGRLQGKTHRLITAVCLLPPEGEPIRAVDVHKMTMRALTGAEIKRYVAADMPIHCCGSYMIEARGVALFEAIEGRDFTAIVGLPLVSVVGMLREAGFEVP